jgi:hypothetical protein
LAGGNAREHFEVKEEKTDSTQGEKDHYKQDPVCKNDKYIPGNQPVFHIIIIDLLSLLNTGYP